MVASALVQNRFFSFSKTLLRNNSLMMKKMLPSQCKSSVFIQQQRLLHLHEYQSMNLMHKYNIPTPLYFPANTPEEAEEGAKQLMSKSKSKPLDFVVKAQVLTGGRGLGYFKENKFKGGVHVCTSPEEVKFVAKKMLGNTLITKQTGEEGKPCNQVLVAEKFYIRKERYFAIILDRASGGPIILASSTGGTNIEDIAEQSPESIVKVQLDLKKEPSVDQLVFIAQQLGFQSSDLVNQVAQSIIGLYKMFIEKDCLLIEVNPFAETVDGRILMCDAKVNFDDNSEYRQKNVFDLKDNSQIDSREVTASQFNLNYVGLDGNVGCMVNGAGLAMATMDLLLLHQGKPANFLDVGGGADDVQVMEALRILQNDPRVKSIFVNIFGGIMRCDIIAQGLISASQKVGLTKPIVVRLEGTNKEQAKKLLDNNNSKMTAVFESDFNEAARKAVKIAAIADLAQQVGVQVSFN